jgi:non-ribosomal peptide synthetase component F
MQKISCQNLDHSCCRIACPLLLLSSLTSAGPQEVFCLNSTVNFDSYVTYVFASLVVGGRLVVPGPTAHLDPTGMAGLIATHGITTMECVPALASEYMYAFREAGDRLACLTRFLTGGEALTPKLAEEIVATLPGLSQGGLFNSYGPTEVSHGESRSAHCDSDYHCVASTVLQTDRP